MSAPIYSIQARRIDGKDGTLADLQGKVALIVNVASKCGLTPQYTALEKVYETYRDKGFTVLGFPANDFKGQEPGTNAEIVEFCTANYGVKFPMFDKITVVGEGRHPLYKHLIAAQPKATANPDSKLRGILDGMGLLPKNESDIMWNFEKFLVAKDGKVVARFAPDITPDDPMVTKAIETELKKS